MANYKQSTRPRPAGFSLIELMVTVGVLALLVAIAVPVYTREVQKARRTDARSAVVDLAGREERFFSLANNYSQLPADLGYAVFPQLVGSGYYTITVAVPDPAFVAAGGIGPSFVITATPVGTQVADSACQSFSDNQIGKQSSLDAGNADSTTTCWN